MVFSIKKVSTLVILSLLVCLATFSKAQAQTPQDIIDSIRLNIQVSVDPEYPRAGDPVTVSLDSSAADLNSATISWIMNGKTQQKGVGFKDFTTTAGAVGTTQKITAEIVTSNGSVVDKQITIEPADVDILWQASSYTPPFYEGKALYPHQGLITFTAVPTLSSSKSITASINNLVYTWKKDGEVLGDFSGYGKNTFSLRGTIISKTFTMEVDVSDKSGVSLGSGFATIKPQSPAIRLYENNPSLGVLYNRLLGIVNLQEKELSIASVPYFFDSFSETPRLQYTWTLNGTIVQNQTDPSQLIVRQTGTGAGSSQIGLQIANVVKTLQFANNSVTVNFGNNNQ